jgi:hypothetical protein
VSNFAAFVASRLAETDFRDSRTETFLREATIRQLRELSLLPVDFLDASYSFNTADGVDNYGAGHLNFPLDLFSWSSKPRVVTTATPISTTHFIHGPVPIQEVRGAGYVSSLTALYPSKFAWHNRTMWLYPVPAGVVNIRGDYRRDGTRDISTGDEITTASTTHTNGWFTIGENVLRCAVMLEWQLSIAKDPASIQGYSAQLQEYRRNLKASASAKKTGALQASDTMFGTDAYEAYWPFSGVGR